VVAVGPDQCGAVVRPRPLPPPRPHERTTSTARATTQRDGLRRAWYWACRAEGIDPRKPSRLPLLFALDATLGIAGGYVYALDCGLLGADRGTTHCAGDLSSGCGGSSGDSGCGRDERRQAPLHDKARRLVGGARGGVATLLPRWRHLG
jgi:hypothetical protein